MTTDSDLLRMVINHEREFGGIIARQHATEQNVSRIAERVEIGFAETKQMVSDAMKTAAEAHAREGAHIRGEIQRLDEAYKQQRRADEEGHKKRVEEERQRTHELITSLRETAERSEAAANKVKQINRRIIFAVVCIGALASTVMENIPALFNFLGHLFDASSFAG